MAVLIIDPSKEGREAAYQAAKWVDARHRVEVVDCGRLGRAIALEWRPELILCEPNLPDISGEQLCDELRSKLDFSTFIAYTESPGTFSSDARAAHFDAVLGKPPGRASVAMHMKKALQARKARKALRPKPVNDGSRSDRRLLWKPQAGNGQSVQVLVSIDKDDLSFAVPVPPGSCVQDVLRQLDRSSATWFSLLRGGQEFPADIATKVCKGDLLLIRT